MKRETVEQILEALFWLATGVLIVFVFLSIFAVSYASGQLTEYKIIQIAKLPLVGICIYIFFWLVRGLIARKWWY